MMEEPDKPKPLRDELVELIGGMAPDGTDGSHRAVADAVMHLLNERGHYLPGCPPARQIMRDAEQFAGQFMLAVLCVRLQRMLGTGIVTPETKGMEKWLSNYIDGKNHGPIGRPMLWPSGLPGLCDQMRKWGYGPTPTRPPFVARDTGQQPHGMLQ